MQEISVYNDERSFDETSGEVSRVVKVSMEYPSLVLESDAETPILGHQFNALKRLTSLDTADENTQWVYVYIKKDGTTVKIGRVADDQMSVVLEIFEKNKKIGFLDSETPLGGALVYTLC